MREAHKEPLYEHFNKQYPLILDGSIDLLKAKQWLDHPSTILDFIGVEGNDRVACSSHTFKDDAYIWWGIASQIRDVRTMTWEKFREVFYENYFSDLV